MQLGKTTGNSQEVHAQGESNSGLGLVTAHNNYIKSAILCGSLYKEKKKREG